MENKPEKRVAGVLLHPTMLPGAYGIGDFGQASRDFLDQLVRMKSSLWQILPLGPTGYGDSPYAARSSFAGNELLIDLRALAIDGFLDIADILSAPSFPTDHVDYAAVRAWKEPLLASAASRFLETADTDLMKEFHEFCAAQAGWLEDYALYEVLCAFYRDSRWFEIWDKDIALREPQALTSWRVKKAGELENAKVRQFFFFRQWQEVRSYAHERGISIIGDLPIFVAGDSADAWSHRELLSFSADGVQTEMGGVPPDAFSATGQLWGNPVYVWEKHEKDDFAWWTSRLEAAFAQVDILRLDHFRGFAACWVVPATAPTAATGQWVPSPGAQLLAAARKRLGTMEVIAEDLGVITPDVEQLRIENGFPGMKIFQFAFGKKNGRFDAHHAYLPHEYDCDSAAYTGTHDNQTSRGWFSSLSDEYKDMVRRYLECGDEEVVWQMIRVILMSRARYTVFPIQDILGCGDEARFNIPGTCGSHNWAWRISPGLLQDWMMERFAGMVERYGRSSGQE